MNNVDENKHYGYYQKHDQGYYSDEYRYNLD